MIDFGLVSLFAVQLILIALTFHAWRGMQSEIKALHAIKQEVKSSEAFIKSLEKRLDTTDAIPKALQARVKELEALADKIDSANDKNSTNLAALNARMSAVSRQIKQQAKTMGPASQDEEENPEGEISPEPEFEFKPVSNVPKGFGQIRRKVG
jgi:chromosome segregation ATPase